MYGLQSEIVSTRSQVRVQAAMSGSQAYPSEISGGHRLSDGVRDLSDALGFELAVLLKWAE